MRAGLIRNGRRGFDHVSLVMVLLVYGIIGGLTGFAPTTSGHQQLEMVHLPNASRDSGAAGVKQIGRVLLSRANAESARSTLGAQTLDGSADAPPKPVANTDNKAAAMALVADYLLSYFPDANQFLDPVTADGLQSASPAWWLRTVILHI
jgi:hypothetical protein